MIGRVSLKAAVIMAMSSQIAAFTVISPCKTTVQHFSSSTLKPTNLFLSQSKNEPIESMTKDLKKLFSTLAIATTLTLNLSPSLPAHANDFAGDTVTSMVKTIDNAAGNTEQTFSAFEDLAAVITEGKGVGGEVSYGGVQLQSGQVADEDTTIYNPGLSLLTESEKKELVNAIIQSKRKALSTNTWSDDNQFGFEFLKQKLDPLHMYELSGYLGILPFYAGALYLGVLAVQQNLRGIFPAAYIAAALAVFLPVGVLIATGP